MMPKTMHWVFAWPLLASIAISHAAMAADVLLIPNSGTDNIMAFDPHDGTLLNEAFIPDPGSVNGFDIFNRPLHAIDSGRGTILVSDQLRHIVAEFNFDGSFVGIFAPVGGQNTTILSNTRGMAMLPNGELLVSNLGSGINTTANSIVRFDENGDLAEPFIHQRYGGIRGPFDVLVLDDKILVASDQSNSVQRYTTAGHFDELFARRDDALNLQVPQQLAVTSLDTILVAVFSGGFIAEFAADGTLITQVNVPGLSGYRGVYELGNGNLLVTSSSGVHEITRSGTLVQTKFTSNEMRYIERIALPDDVAAARLDRGATQSKRSPPVDTPLNEADERGESAKETDQ